MLFAFLIPLAVAMILGLPIVGRIVSVPTELSIRQNQSFVIQVVSQIAIIANICDTNRNAFDIDYATQVTYI